MDIRLTDNFDFALDHRNDMPLVTGREAFEQDLRVRLTDYFTRIIGQGTPQSVQSFIQMQARRVASEMDMVDEVSSITIEPSADSPNSLDVSVIYVTNDEFSFLISE